MVILLFKIKFSILYIKSEYLLFTNIKHPAIYGHRLNADNMPIVPIFSSLWHLLNILIIDIPITKCAIMSRCDFNWNKISKEFLLKNRYL